MKKAKYILILLLSMSFINVFADDYSNEDGNVRISLPIFVNYKYSHFDYKCQGVKITYKNEEFNDENIEVTIHKPLIEMNNSKIEKNINSKIDKIIEDFIEKLSIAGKDNNEYYIENKLPLKQYVVNVNNAIHYNKDNILSLTLNLYSYMGGAHGSTENISLNIDTKTGKVGVLKDFLGNNEGYDEIILNEIKNEVNKNPNMYFVNEVDKIKTLPYNQKFFIEDDFVVVYFDEYAIAPYVAGSPEFRVSLSKLPKGLNKIDIKEEIPILYTIVEEEFQVENSLSKYINVLQLKEYIPSNKYDEINQDIKKKIQRDVENIYEKENVKGVTSYISYVFNNKDEITFEINYIIDKGNNSNEELRNKYLIDLNTKEIIKI